MEAIAIKDIYDIYFIYYISESGPNITRDTINKANLS